MDFSKQSKELLDFFSLYFIGICKKNQHEEREEEKERASRENNHAFSVALIPILKTQFKKKNKTIDLLYQSEVTRKTIPAPK